tara:strand:+ start:33 stop:170 length:138 start_codon:yes stop_codon:yes gene_type:complete
MPAIPPIPFTIEKSEIFYEYQAIPDKKKMHSCEPYGLYATYPVQE